MYLRKSKAIGPWSYKIIESLKDYGRAACFELSVLEKESTFSRHAILFIKDKEHISRNDRKKIISILSGVASNKITERTKASEI